MEYNNFSIPGTDMIGRREYAGDRGTLRSVESLARELRAELDKTDPASSTGWARNVPDTRDMRIDQAGAITLAGRASQGDYTAELQACEREIELARLGA